MPRDDKNTFRDYLTRWALVVVSKLVRALWKLRVLHAAGFCR
jgi:hypothetical protein